MQTNLRDIFSTNMFNVSQPDTENRPRTIFGLMHAVGLEIIVMMKSNCNWIPFTFQDYEQFFPEIKDLTGVMSVLNHFVNLGLLTENEGIYTIEDNFFKFFYRYIVTNDTRWVDAEYLTIKPNGFLASRN